MTILLLISLASTILVVGVCALARGCAEHHQVQLDDYSGAPEAVKPRPTVQPTRSPSDAH